MFFLYFYFCFTASYDQLQHKTGHRFYLPTKNNKPMETVQTKRKELLNFWEGKFLGGLHTLDIREHSSGSVVSDMALYYTQ